MKSTNFDWPNSVGTKFLLWTDHFPLQYLFTAKDPWVRRARWIAELQEYCFATEYTKGDQNKVADALSRLGFGNGEKQIPQEDKIAIPGSFFSPQEISPKFCMLTIVGGQPLLRIHRREIPFYRRHLAMLVKIHRSNRVWIMQNHYHYNVYYRRCNAI